MLELVQPAPPDAILGLTQAFNEDPRPDKINLGVGVYKDEAGDTPVLRAVKAAEARLLETDHSKSYFPIDGRPQLARHARAMLFGDTNDLVDSPRAFSAQTPGGTGGLRVAGDFLKANLPNTTVHLSDPTWANHHGIFLAAGLQTRTYPYLDRLANALAFDQMLAGLETAKPQDVVLLHACCHNPTGIDPTPEQWQQIAQLLADKQLFPLIDFAYQGFGEGLELDAAGLHAIADACPEFMVTASYSKNFGLYRERIGALTVVAADAKAAAAAKSQVKQSIRRNYSNPPAHGGAVVQTILDDPQLTADWKAELATMRDRINSTRQTFRDKLDACDTQLSSDGNAFITRQKGMFTLSGLSKNCVEKLREDHAIYIVGSGRINVAGMTPDNLPRLCDAIGEVVHACA
ncbi:MAG: amino acid aminotransferase [Planctomycetota bacterium]